MPEGLEFIRLAGSTVDNQQIAVRAVEESAADIEKKLFFLVIKWSTLSCK